MYGAMASGDVSGVLHALIEASDLTLDEKTHLHAIVSVFPNVDARVA